MDDIERLLIEARPASGRRGRPLSARAEYELDALVGTESVEARTGVARAVRFGARMSLRRHVLALSLGVGVLVIATVLGTSVALDDTVGGTRLIAESAIPDPSSVLLSAADSLDESGARPENATESAGAGTPEVADGMAIVDALTSGDITRMGQVSLLDSLGTSGRATEARRGLDADGDVVWRVEIDAVTLVIHAETGVIVAVVDAGGVEYRVDSLE